MDPIERKWLAGNKDALVCCAFIQMTIKSVFLSPKFRKIALSPLSPAFLSFSLQVPVAPVCSLNLPNSTLFRI